MNLFQYAFLKDNPLYDQAQLEKKEERDAILQQADSVLISMYANTDKRADLFGNLSLAKDGTQKKLLNGRVTALNPIGSIAEKANFALFTDIINGCINKHNTQDELLSNIIFYLCKQYLSVYPKGNLHQSLSYFEWLKLRASLIQINQTAYKNTTNPYLLVCGDISGIQEFVYSIHSSKAAKSLKGRSFYLTILLDSLLRSILEGTNSNQSNIIFASGGKFYLLLPNTAAIQEKLIEIRNAVEENIFEELKGTSLYLCLGWAEFNIRENGAIASPIKLRERNPDVNTISELFKAATQQAEDTKRRKYYTLSQSKDGFKKMFQGYLHEEHNGKNNAICAATGLPFPDNQLQGIGNDTKVSKWVKEQIDLGEKLKDCNFVQVSKNGGGINPLKLGYRYKLIENNTANNAENLIFEINPTNTDWYKQAQGYWWYGGNKQALNGTKNKTFDEFAKKETIMNGNTFVRVENGFQKMAILRMDVDSLSELFTAPHRDADKMFSGFASMANLLDHFFSGYLNTIRNSTDFKNDINILYSGGDDLFVIGRWDKTISFANKTQEEFTKFVGTDTITLSAGMVVVTAKYPIQKAAELAGDALDIAKKYPQKNAICLLDFSHKYTKYTINNKPAYMRESAAFEWGKGSDWAFAYSLGLELSKNRGFPKSMIYRLFHYEALKSKGLEDWKWKAAYMVSNHSVNTPNQKHLLVNIYRAIISDRYDSNTLTFTAYNKNMLELICLACKIADYLTR